MDSDLGKIATNKLVLGKEYDEALRIALISILRELGGSSKDSQWLVGGSQELDIVEVDIQGRIVTVEAETYVGLSISGDADIVDEVAARVRALPRYKG